MALTPYPYQTELAKQAAKVLSKFGLVYLAMEERTGKSLTGLLALQEAGIRGKVLVVTKKKALGGWEQTVRGCVGLTDCEYVVTNYHGVVKLDEEEFDAVVLDESHSYISAFPKRGTIWKSLRNVCAKKPIVYMSATPYAQGIHLLFNQFALCSYSPWKRYSTYYAWYRDYAELDRDGNLPVIWVRGGAKNDYTKANRDKALADVEDLFITKTRQSLGFSQEPEDVLHYVELSEPTKSAYNLLVKHKVLNFSVGGKDHQLVADSVLKLRTALHMLEGGTLKVDKDYIELTVGEKIDYIKEKFGDSSDLAIMHHYVAEGEKLRKAFKNAHILQGTSYAEGVDLSHIDTLVVYSQDFSTSKHIQRRARQAHKDRDKPIQVHFLLVKKAISLEVYSAVSVNKRNYSDRLFEGKELT